MVSDERVTPAGADEFTVIGDLVVKVFLVIDVEVAKVAADRFFGDYVWCEEAFSKQMKEAYNAVALKCRGDLRSVLEYMRDRFSSSPG